MMKEKTPDYAVSPRWVAKEKGFELISEDGESYEYKHPESGIGLLITVRYSEWVKGPIFDWSIHEPQTERVIAAEYNQADGTSFLKELIQLLADPSLLTDSSEDPVEDSEPKGICHSCKTLRVLDSNGFCYFC